jgi:hypothetical protein
VVTDIIQTQKINRKILKSAICTLDERPNIFLRRKHTLSSERTKTTRFQLKNKISGRESQGAWRQDQLIGGKSPVVK